MGWVVVIRNWLRLSNNLTVSAAKQRARSNSMASWSNVHALRSPVLKRGNSECMHVMRVQVLRYGKDVGVLLTPLTVPCHARKLICIMHVSACRCVCLCVVVCVDVCV